MATVPTPRRKPIVSTILGIAQHSHMGHDRFKASVTFTYTSETPYSVILDIALIDDSMPGEPPQVWDTARWEIARSLLSDALTGRRLPTLIGDARVSVLDSCTAQIRLMDPVSCPHDQRHFDLHLDLFLVRQFIERMLAAVPAGDEHLFLDVDGALAELFGDDRHRSSGA